MKFCRTQNYGVNLKQWLVIGARFLFVVFLCPLNNVTHISGYGIFFINYCTQESKFIYFGFLLYIFQKSDVKNLACFLNCHTSVAHKTT